MIWFKIYNHKYYIIFLLNTLERIKITKIKTLNDFFLNQFHSDFLRKKIFTKKTCVKIIFQRKINSKKDFRFIFYFFSKQYLNFFPAYAELQKKRFYIYSQDLQAYLSEQDYFCVWKIFKNFSKCKELLPLIPKWIKITFLFY